MGGPGSGRLSGLDRKMLVSETPCIDIRRWSRQDLLAPGMRFSCTWRVGDRHHLTLTVAATEDRLRLQHSVAEAAQLGASYDVGLDHTPTHFGAGRRWFLCPVAKCGRRVALLYARPVFCCRGCADLRYASQYEGPFERAIRRADKLRMRLDWRPGIAHGPEPKPPHMRWARFEKLQRDYARSLVRVAAAAPK